MSAWLWVALALSALLSGPTANAASGISLGVRPQFLLDSLTEGPLKQRLAACVDKPLTPQRFSIGHRGAPLQFPEHTRESYVAAARQGAGIVECDVAFTRDTQLVCRHDQCDLHASTDILTRPELAAQCSVPFTPADPETGVPANARCCTTDLTLAQFRQLNGKMDGVNPRASTVEEFLAGSPTWRTDLYASRGTLLSHAEAIELFESLGVGHIPEAKAANQPVPAVLSGYARTHFLDAIVADYRTAKVPASRVWLQSFLWPDVTHWLGSAGDYAQQVVYLDDRMFRDRTFSPSLEDFREKRAAGLYAIAPPLPVLLTVEDDRIVPSRYARLARQAGLELVTWTLERSPPLAIDDQSYYYRGFGQALRGEGDVFEVLRVLHEELQVVGVFSDWPATTTFFANCLATDPDA